MQQHLAAPCEQVLLTGFEMRGSFVIIGRGHELAILLVDLTEQIVQLAIFLLFE